MILRSASRPFITVSDALSVSGSSACSASGDGIGAKEVTLMFSMSGEIMMACFSTGWAFWGTHSVAEMGGDGLGSQSFRLRRSERPGCLRVSWRHDDRYHIHHTIPGGPLHQGDRP